MHIITRCVRTVSQLLPQNAGAEPIAGQKQIAAVPPARQVPTGVPFRDLYADAEGRPITSVAVMNWRSGNRIRMLALALAALMAMAMGLEPAIAGERVALVVGNSLYRETSPLPNPANDATDVAQLLRDVGFRVLVRTNTDKGSFDAALAEFARLSKGADAALFYYAGHGMQYNGRNYLMPVDAELEDVYSLRFRMVSLDDVRDALDLSSGVKIMVLDACRNNPLSERFIRAISPATRDGAVTRGLAPPPKARGTLIAYATQADDVAQDGFDRNSPFTAAFLQHAREPGVEVGSVFRRIARDVHDKTSGRQLPELSVSLLQDFYLVPPTGADMGKAPQASLPVAPPPVVAPAIPVAPPKADPPASVASLQPAAAMSDKELSAGIGTQLQRLGCIGNAADLAWTSAAMRQARTNLTRLTGLPSDKPTGDLLMELQARTEKVCSLACGPREVPLNGACVAKACPEGEVLSASGQCARKTAVAKPAAKTVTRSAPVSSGSKCFVFDGKNYCQ